MTHMLHAFRMANNTIQSGMLAYLKDTKYRLYSDPGTFSNDILKRWTFPIVPETNLQESDIYEYSRGNIYKGSRVMLSK